MKLKFFDSRKEKIITKYFKHTIIHLNLWVVFYISYNFYFGFNFKALTFAEALCDIFSQIYLFLWVLILLFERDIFFMRYKYDFVQVMTKFLERSNLNDESKKSILDDLK